MRDIALTVFLLGSLPVILMRPTYGVFLWVWVGIMNPHRLTWGFAYDMPFAMLIAIATVIGVFLSREPKKLPITPVTAVLFLFTLWMNVTTVFSLAPSSAWIMWEKVMKIQLMIFVTLYVLHTRQHIQTMLWVMTLSVAFFGIKGGIFTVLGGGEYRVYGPAGSFIEENNSMALATIMMMPLLWHLRSLLPGRYAYLKWLFPVAMLICTFSVLGSHSRGALLAIAAMLGFFWLKSRHKAIMGMAFVVVLPLVIGFMPAAWDERMRSIETYEEDSSAMGRINSWRMAINLASDRPLVGGGFEMYDAATFARYAPNPLDIHSAHSIYFQVLGEHGYVGLALFLILWFLVWRDAAWIVRRTNKQKGWEWANDMARMIQAGLAGYAIGGAFLNLAYYDFPYYMLVAVVLTRVLVAKELEPQRGGWRTVPPAGRTENEDRPEHVPARPQLQLRIGQPVLGRPDDRHA